MRPSKREKARARSWKLMRRRQLGSRSGTRRCCTSLRPPPLVLTTMPKAAAPRKGAQMKHDPLAVQLRAGEADDTGAFSQPGKRQKATKKRHQEEEVRPAVLSASYVHELILVWCAQSALSAKTTAKVLAMAREQQDELAGEDIDELAGDVECVLFHYVRCSAGRANTRPSCARQRDGGEPAAPRRRRRRRRLQRRGRLRGVRGAGASPSTRPCAAG